MVRPLIAGNWKMNGSYEALSMIQSLQPLASASHAEVLISCPFPYLSQAKDKAGSDVLIGAQNCHSEEKGAFTGEVSASMLADIGVDYCILGHSERRTLFGETDAFIADKIKAVCHNHVKPILCIGETQQQREQGITEKVILDQLNNALTQDSITTDLVIAYEPVWAIGTGLTATPKEIDSVHNLIRSWLSDQSSKAGDIRLLYGGSMNENNAQEILAIENVNGGLIGGASLKLESFSKIIEAAA